MPRSVFLCIVFGSILAFVELSQGAGNSLTQRGSLLNIAIFTPCDRKTQVAELLALLGDDLAQVVWRMISKCLFLCHINI